MELLEDTEMPFMPVNGLVLLFVLGILCFLLSCIFWIIVFKNFICLKAKKVEGCETKI